MNPPRRHWIRCACGWADHRWADTRAEAADHRPCPRCGARLNPTHGEPEPRPPTERGIFQAAPPTRIPAYNPAYNPVAAGRAAAAWLRRDRHDVVTTINPCDVVRFLDAIAQPIPYATILGHVETD